MAKVDIKEVLEEVLKANGVPSHYYSFDGYAESSVCMEETSDGALLVYGAERGNKFNVEIHPKLVNALYDIISRVTDSDEDERKIKAEFAEKVLFELYND